MRGVNRVTIAGNLGSDPDIVSFNNGGKIANISIATSDKWNDKETGELREKTEWHRIVLHGKVVNIAEKYLKKGSAVYVEGKLSTRSYDKDGQKFYVTEIHADNMQMLSGKPQEQQ